MLTDIDGVKVGHWTDSNALTGCTVVVLPENTVASGDIRGGAPATREFAVLDPLRMVQSVDAVVLSGGSAFGLAACDGVAVELERQGRGFATGHGVVPIVIGMSLFDLAVGDPAIRPGASQGAEALLSARTGPHAVGKVGAGTGATVNKWAGPSHVERGGLGAATERFGNVVVSALFAVNALGAVDTSGTALSPESQADHRQFGSNTTIGVVVTNAIVDKVGCNWLAQSAHDGLARSLLPAHTQFDGDAVVAVATGEVVADPLQLRVLVQAATVQAVRSSVN